MALDSEVDNLISECPATRLESQHVEHFLEFHSVTLSTDLSEYTDLSIIRPRQA